MDADSEMRSSDESSTELFPESSNPLNDPPTPGNNSNNLSAIERMKTSELSPPTSQDPPGQSGQLNEGPLDHLEEMADEAGSIDPRQFPSSLLPGQTRESDEPGAGWKNKKAEDDFQRAWHDVIDKDFAKSISMPTK